MLGSLGVPFTVVASGEAEDSDEGLPAAERVMAHARGKAREVHPLLWVTAALFVLYFAIDPFKELVGVG